MVVAPTIQLFSQDPSSGNPLKSITLKKKDQRQSYIVRLSELDGDDLSAPALTVEQTNLTSEDLQSDNLAVAALHYEPSGHLFLEPLHKSETLYSRPWTGKRLIPPFRTIGKPSLGRVLLQLEEDKEFIFAGQRFAIDIGSSVDDIIATNINEKPIPRLQVAYSMQDASDMGGNSIFDSYTPNFPEIPEEGKVYETPAVKSRFLDPNSSPRQRPSDESPSRSARPDRGFVASRLKSGLITGGHLGGRPGETGDTQLSNVDDADLSASDNEEGSTRQGTYTSITSAQRPVAIDGNGNGDLDEITATPGNEIPLTGRREGAPVAPVFGDSGVTSPSEPGSQPEPVLIPSTAPEYPISPSLTPFQTAPSPEKNRNITPTNEGTNISDEEMSDGKKQPDSLPDGFIIHKPKHTPAKKYGKKRSSTGSNEDQKPSSASKNNTRKDREQTVETEASTAPLTAAQKKERKRKVIEKPQEPESTASNDDLDITTRDNKKRKTASEADEDMEMQDAVAEEAEEELETIEVPRKRGRPKKAETGTSKAVKSTTKTPRGKRAVRNDEDEGDGDKSPVLKETPAKKASSKTPSRKRALTPPAEVIRNDTQYTFPDIDDEEEEASSKLRAGPKTPKPKKTPTARSVTASTRKKRALDHLAGDKDSSPAPATNVRTTDKYEEAAPRIVFSNSTLDNNKGTLSFIRSASGKVLTAVTDPACNFLVVGPGEVKRTPKVTIAIALGITIVEETWIIDSKAVGYFVDPDVYVPDDAAREKEWKCSIADAVERGKRGENKILEDYTVYLTPGLMSQVKATNQESLLVDMCTAAGATQVIKKAPRGPEEEDEMSVVLGVEKGDPDVKALEKEGRVVYSTALVGVGVGRGRLELDSDEFRVPPAEGEENVKKGRSRKK